MNVAELAANEIRRFGEHTSLVFQDQEWTNVAMERAARKLGNALRKLGVKRGDRVVINMPNCPEVFQSFQAVWKIGAVAVPVNYLIGEGETAHIYQDCGAGTVIGSPDLLSKIEAARARAGTVKNVILVDKLATEGTRCYSELLSESHEELETIKTHDDEIAALVYTAGTTGKPKGVMHSHYGLYSCARMVMDTLTWPEGQVSIFVLPLCHMYGLGIMITGSLKGGGKGVVLPTFDIEKIFEAIERYRGHYFAGVPTMYVYMLLYPYPDKYDLSSMWWWQSGSAPLTLETWKGFKEKYGFEIVEGWGLTETAALNCTNPIRGPIKVGSIGKPMKGTEMKIVDSAGCELPLGQEGEIIIRTPSLMKGYWGKPEETAQVLKNGWLYTGDIGYVDADGYFFITDRKKDLIIKAGENIHPREIDEVICAHPKVCEAAAVGIRDEIYGEDIKAFVVLKPGEQASPEEIIDWCCARLKRFKSPKEIRFVDALPKNLIGKVLRRELRAME
jgi:long-chain acyl-CoA synthetase